MTFKEARIKAGLTQEEVAQKLGLNRSTIARWETGIGLPRADSLADIADVLGCTIDDLLRK